MISVIIISYNSLEYLSDCFNSVLPQLTHGDELIVIDNASSDGSQNFIRHSFPQALFVESKVNLGYAKAANLGIRESSGDYILILNPDAVLGENYIAEAIQALDRQPRAAGISGKTYQLNSGNQGKPSVIDSVGLAGSKGRQFLDMGAAVNDDGQFSAEGEIFGICGHCSIFRRVALEDALIEDEYFDEDFFMYKEDVDICWRLRLFGWIFWYSPSAIAYHRRGTGILARNGLANTLHARQTLNQIQKYYSFRNHRLMLIKNEFWGSFAPDSAFIIFRELGATAWLLVRETRNASALIDVFRLLPKTLQKRRAIMIKRQVNGKQILPWLRGRWG